jgi:hypothetical protein
MPWRTTVGLIMSLIPVVFVLSAFAFWQKTLREPEYVGRLYQREAQQISQAVGERGESVRKDLDAAQRTCDRWLAVREPSAAGARFIGTCRQVLHLVVLRLLFLWYVLPLALLAALLGLVEGLRLRARKKEEFGYLSARKLHVAIRLVLPLSLVAACAYLLMPVPTSPGAVMAAAPLVLGPVCLLAAANLPEKI